MAGTLGKFIAVLVAVWAFLGALTFYNMEIHVTGRQFMWWFFETVPVGWIIMIGAMIWMGIIIVGGVLYFGTKLRLWFIRWRGPGYHRYDDPKYQD